MRNVLKNIDKEKNLDEFNKIQSEIKSRNDSNRKEKKMFTKDSPSLIRTDLVIKLLVPVAIAYFAYTQNESQEKNLQELQNASLRIQDANLRIQKISTNIQLINIVWSDITSGNELQKMNGLALLESFEPELKILITNALKRSKTLEQKFSSRISRIANIAKYQKPITNYKIDIYYYKGSTSDKLLAENLKNQLIYNNIGRKVITAPRNKGLFSETEKPFSIRYNLETESQAAKNLAKIIIELDSTKKPYLTQVYTKTLGTISIFVSVK